MVTSARRRSRRGEGERLRREILDATEALLVRTNDVDAVSLRGVADAVGVTPPAIYMHFASKDDLVLEVCERIFHRLDAVIEDSECDQCDALEAVKRIGRAYVRFGLDHPEQYRLLFMTRTPQLTPEAVRDRILGVSGFSRVVEAAQRCIDERAIESDDDEDAFTIACSLWMSVHGITSLLISKPTFPWPEQETLIEGCIETFCRGLARGGPA